MMGTTDGKGGNALRYGAVAGSFERKIAVLTLCASMVFCTGVQVVGLLMGAVGELGFVMPAGFIGLMCAYCAAHLLRGGKAERLGKRPLWCALASLPLMVEIGLFAAVYGASFNAVFLIHALQVFSVVLTIAAVGALVAGVWSDGRLFALYGICTAYLLIHGFIFHALCDMTGAPPLEAMALRVAVLGIVAAVGAAAAVVWKILR